MTPDIYPRITVLCWLVILAYWVVMSRGNKESIYRQPRPGRLLQFASMTICYVLLYHHRFERMTWLDMALYPKNHITGVLGVVVCTGGVAFAIWARSILGKNWSGEVTLKKNHELIRKGPYRFVRHPIYTGLLFGLIGTALTVGELRAPLAIIICFAAIIPKLKLEEKMLTLQFPDDYPQYRKQTKMLIPFVV